ncbi:a1-alpha2 repression [Boothiomyces macroporosus]|uniref:A1-alpha2 repression n=1 Tax=Boothiomyces macroporosus TaxID=261099 RepID=A0AAD5Y6J3_9FUNG|nr:a1-alpha2 repression [Boothiomyces macroporosus]
MSIGSTLLLLDAPNNLEFGIDFNSWKVGPKFRGMRLIPPGIHFVHYSLNEFKTGFFINCTNETMVYKWSSENEQFEPFQLDIIPNYDEYLGLYPKEMTLWKEHFEYINMKTVNRMISNHVNNGSSSLYSVVLEKELQRDLDKLALATNSEPITVPTKEKTDWVNFTSLNLKYSYPPNATPSEITKYSVDKSYLLSLVLDILAEFSITFILFHLGQFYDAFEHWKTLVKVITSSIDFIESENDTFKKLIKLFIKQIKEFPPDFDLEFIHWSCINLVENCLECGVETDFVLYLNKKFGWDLLNETEQPLVVE